MIDHPTRVGMSVTTVGLGGGSLLQDLHNTSALDFANTIAPYLADLSYLVGFIAGVVTIYFAFKNRNK